MTNKTSSFQAAPTIPLGHRHGGRFTAMSELSIHAMGDDYVVEGNGVIRSLPTMPVGTSAVLRIVNAPTFTNSSKLICQNASDYVGSPGDLVFVRSDGDGVWRLYVIPAAPIVSVNGQVGAVALYSQPQGRLTLTSGTAMTTSDVCGATSICCTPVGNQVPIYNGTNFAPTIFYELTLALDSTSTTRVIIKAAKCSTVCGERQRDGSSRDWHGVVV